MSLELEGLDELLEVVFPDDELPDASLLSKFRTLHLDDTTLDDVLTEIVRQCISKGIIKESSGISLDSTHIEANTTKKIPERIIKHLAQRIFKAEGMGEIKSDIRRLC